jgi:hypothetical protein
MTSGQPELAFVQVVEPRLAAQGVRVQRLGHHLGRESLVVELVLPDHDWGRRHAVLEMLGEFERGYPLLSVEPILLYGEDVVDDRRS